MNLPFIKHQNPPEKREYFFVVEIGLGSVQVALGSIVNAKPQILAIGNSVLWKGDNAENLIQSVDQSLSIACEKGGIGPENQPSKIILGLPSDWISQDKIIPQRLAWLKMLSSKLELKPVGFVIEHEAITRFVQQNEGVPVTAILLLVWPDYLETTLIRLGKVVGTVLVRKSQNLTEDVVEGLARLPRVEMLPSRIFLTGSGVDMEQARQLLLNYAWTTPSKKFSFLHFPKVEILASDFGAKAIAFSVGTEAAELFESEPVVEKPQEPQETPSDFGFSVEDVAVVKQDKSEPELPIKIKKKINFKLPNFSVVFAGILVLMLTVGAVGAIYWFIPKATISITIVPKSISQSIEMVVSTKTNNVDTEKMVIPAKLLEVEVRGDQTAPATGNKLVGDKATGTVTITNNVGTTRTLSAGTILTSTSGLKFVIDETIAVASASGFPPNIQYGKATVKATASQIGSDYNLSAGTDFRVGTYSSLETAAKNEVAFSGGTSRQVKSVAKEDVLNLKTALTEKLKNEAKTKLSSQIEADSELITESIVISTVSEDLNHKLDDPADSLKLSMVVKARAFVYKKTDLDEIISSKILSLTPEGYLPQGALNKVFNVKQIDKEGAKFLIKISTTMWPKIDNTDLPLRYAGKGVGFSIADLEKLVGVSSVDIEVRPKLPLFNDRLPLKSKNIWVDIKEQ